MYLIWKNPYRVLGVWAGANDREIIRQKTRLKAYLKVNKEIETDTDLSFLSHVNRSEETVQKAISSIEKTDQKIIHSLFWFSKLTPIDDTAIDYFTNGNIDKAAEIWSKPAHQSNVSLRKVSAINNLSTLEFAVALSESGNHELTSVNEALSLKLQILNFDSLKILADSFGDKTFLLDSSTYKSIVKKFFLLLQKEIKSHASLNGKNVRSLFGRMDEDVRQIAEKVFSGESISTIESALSTAKKKRTDNPSKANIAGKHLYSRVYEPLKQLENILGHENITYQMLSDKVAQELIECGIVYYNHHTKGYEIDPGDDSINLLKKAKNLAVGLMVKDRIKKNLPIIEEWQNNKVSRDRFKIVLSEMKFINKKIDHAISGVKTIKGAKELISACKPKLAIIKDKLGAASQEYILICSDVVAVTQSMIVTDINKKQEKLRFFPITQLDIDNFNSDVRESINVMESMRALPKNPELQGQYNNNLDTIYSLKRQSSSNSQSDCYIATMAYGSYEHPQVLKLRLFRDNVLSKSSLGRSFITFYYATSPNMVEILSEFKSIHTFIRKACDKFIKLIRY